MGLEHELLELNTAYQACQSANAGLRNRVQQLEELVKDYQMFCSRLTGFMIGGVDGTQEEWIGRLMDMQQRAKELLG